MFKKRIVPDSNGFYHVQIMDPQADDWQTLADWCTVFITRIYENARKRLEQEPGLEAE